MENALDCRNTKCGQSDEMILSPTMAFEKDESDWNTGHKTFHIVVTITSIFVISNTPRHRLCEPAHIEMVACSENENLGGRLILSAVKAI